MWITLLSSRWCVITQHLLPVWPWSPGGSSAAVAIQSSNSTQTGLRWRSDPESLLISFLGDRRCVWTWVDEKKTHFRKREKKISPDDFMSQILTPATLAYSADGGADPRINLYAEQVKCYWTVRAVHVVTGYHKGNRHVWIATFNETLACELAANFALTFEYKPSRASHW